MSPQILLVEDDRGIAEPLQRGLVSHDYEVTWATTAAEARAAVETRTAAGQTAPDLILLDLGLPDLDGVVLCRQLRELAPDCVIVILTARDAEVDVVMGLEAGADDYLVKPFRFAELTARVRAHLRRQGTVMRNRDATAVAEERLDVAEVSLDLSARRCFIGGVEVALRPKEFDLLRVLLSEPGHAFSREELMSRVWDEHWYGSTKTLDMHIGMLRRRLAEAGVTADRITTLRGHGYRFEVGNDRSA